MKKLVLFSIFLTAWTVHVNAIRVKNITGVAVEVFFIADGCTGQRTVSVSRLSGNGFKIPGLPVSKNISNVCYSQSLNSGEETSFDLGSRQINQVKVYYSYSCKTSPEVPSEQCHSLFRAKDPTKSTLIFHSDFVREQEQP